MFSECELLFRQTLAICWIIMSLDLHQITDTLVRTGLLTESVVQQTSASLAVEQPNFDVQEWLQELLTTGHLTPFQVDQIRAGRGNSLVLGNYVLQSQLGEGGMGTVYKALHVRMQRVVALKMLKPKIAASPEFMERFYREVRAAARLNHANAVAAYDADDCEVGHFLVMEFVDGADLADIVKTTGALTVNEAVSAIRQAAEAFEYAHAHGIVHRDIKPANLIRDVNGVVKVADLGLARLDPTPTDIEQQAELTREG
ncbi:MAG: serine/threonine-protein kinase, partial [Planctomycetota bacterium]|nr:serine/threonine-protein kinase [Planctomycetota bacterium]